MHHEPLDVVPLWVLFAAAAAFGWLALEGGYRFGAWRHARIAEEKESPVGAMVGSILGLLAFMLAFTFGLAANRFDARRQIVVEEANAIGTTYLRARFLPESQQSYVVKALEKYVDVRLEAVRSGDVASAIKQSEELHANMWSKAVEASKDKEANAIMVGLFVQSLNEVIDLHAKRVQVGTRNRVPSTIWFVLFALALLSMAAIGYQSGLSATRRSPAMVGVVLAFAGVIFLIADLDRGQEGSLKVGQQSLLELQRSMQAGKQ